MIVVLWTTLSIVALLAASSHGNRYTDNIPTFDVNGTTFLNTQTTTLCLLAGLNASVVLLYKNTETPFTVNIPSSASNKNSVCDYNFVSTLALDFKGTSFKLNFVRDQVPPKATQTTYCDKCDNGNWKLQSIDLNIDDVSHLFHGAHPPPSTRIVATAHGSDLSAVAGGLSTGVSVHRGYRCTDQRLVAQMKIDEAVDLTTNQSSASEWTVHVQFDHIEVQPFLVTDSIIKDPLLCKDVELFIALIITLPLIYFIIFVLFHRVKDRFGCPPNWKGAKFEKFDESKKPPTSSGSATKTLMISSSDANPIVLTCTSPEEAETSVL